jgi:ABC-type bacteriocin/lantibiotic exporter with double-glycine peptidase domain
MKLNHVMQLDSEGCGIACIAMLVNKSYSEIRDLVVDIPITQRILEDLLYQLDIRFRKPAYDDLVPDRLYIVCVPSLNNIGGMHYIIVDMRGTMKVYDPNKGRIDVSIYDHNNLMSWGRVLEIL